MKTRHYHIKLLLLNVSAQHKCFNYILATVAKKITKAIYTVVYNNVYVETSHSSYSYTTVIKLLKIDGYTIIY